MKEFFSKIFLNIIIATAILSVAIFLLIYLVCFVISESLFWLRFKLNLIPSRDINYPNSRK